MDKVNMSEYEAERVAFYKKHNSENLSWPKEDTEFKNGVTRKTVTFEDGAIWYEVSTKITEERKAKVEGVPEFTINLSLDLLKTEFWSSDNSISKYAYDLFDYRAIRI